MIYDTKYEKDMEKIKKLVNKTFFSSRLTEIRVAHVLIRMLSKEDYRVRAAAAKELGRIGGERAVKPLLDRLQDESSDVREEAAYALGIIGDIRAGDLLIKALQDTNYGVKKAAVHALGSIGDTRAASLIIDLLDDKSEDLREAAAYAVGKLEDARAEESLIDLLTDEYVCVRKEAATALVKLGKKKWYGVIKGDYEDFITIAQLKDRRFVKPLIKALNYDHYTARRSAAEALGIIGDIEAKEPLIKLLVDINDWVRKAAAKALYKLGETKWCEVIKGDVDDFIRVGQSGDPHAETLLLCVLNINDVNIRAKSAEALGELGDLAAVEPLIALLGDETPSVREAAAKALGRLRDKKAVEPLIDVLGDENAGVRKQAAAALGELGDNRAVISLIETLEDSSESVRKYSAVSLGKLGDKEAVSYIIPHLSDIPCIRMAAAASLKCLGENTWNDIIKGDNKDFIRLCQYDPPKGIEMVISGFKYEEYKEDFSRVNALKEIEGSISIEPLINALNDDSKYIKHAAVKLLGNTNSKAAVAPLINILADDIKYIRKEAAEQLNRLGESHWKDIVNGDETDFLYLAKEDDSRIPYEKLLPKLSDYLNNRRHNVRLEAALTMINLCKKYSKQFEISDIEKEVMQQKHTDYETSGEHTDKETHVDQWLGYGYEQCSYSCNKHKDTREPSIHHDMGIGIDINDF